MPFIWKLNFSLFTSSAPIHLASQYSRVRHAPPGKLACAKAPHHDGAHRTIIVSRTEHAAQPSRVILATFPRSDGADCDGKGGCANIPECTTLPPGKLACAKAPHHDGAHRTIIVSRTERAAQPSRVILATFPRSDGADCDGKGGCANIPECATLPPGKLACDKAPHYDGAHRTIIVSRTERAAQPSRVIVATFPRSDGADCDGKGGCANIPECTTLPPGKLACAKAPHHDGAHRTIIVSRTERAAQPSRVIVATFPRSDGADCDGKGGCANIPECATLPPGKLACDKAPHHDGAHRTIIVSRTERAAQPSRVIVATFPRSDGADCDGKGGCANIPECATLPPGKLACDKAPHHDGAHRTIIVSRTERAAQPSRVIVATFPRSDGADCDGKGGCANIPECATLPPGKLACDKAPHYDGAHRTIIVSRTERAAQPSRVIVATFPRSDGADCDGKGGCANIPECATLPPGKLACDKAPHYDGAHRTIIVSRTERAAQPSRVIVATFPRSDGADCDGKGGCANIPECATLPPGKLACGKAPHYDGAHRTIIVSRTERAAQPSRVIVATFPRSDGADCDGKGGCANIPECATLPPGKLACDKAPHYDGAHRTIIVSRTERAAQPSRVIVATFPRSDGADCDGKGGCANIPECTTLPPGKLACAKAPHHDGAHRTIIVSRTERAAQPSRVIVATFPRSDGADCDGKGGCANIPECATLPPGKLACDKAPHHDGAHRTIIVSRTERAAQPSRVIVATFPRSDGADCDGKGGCANIPECATLPPGKLACDKAPHYDGAHRTIIVSRTERAAQPSRVIVATFPRSDGADCDGKGGCANIPECATLPPGKLACDKAPHYDGAHRTIIVSRTERAAQPSRVIVATFPRSDGADCDGKGGCANIPECATLPPGKLACAKAPHHDGAHRTIIVSRTERAAQPSRVIVATFPRSDGADCDGKGGCANIPECTTLPPGKLACAKAPHHDGAHRTIIVSRTERAAQPSRVIVATFPRSDGADCDGKGGCANIPECATLPPGKLACDKAPHYDGAHRTIIVSRTERAAQPSRVIVATFPRSDGADCDGKGGCANIPECATLPPGKLACDKAPHYDGAHRTIIVSRTERAAQPSRVIVATFPRSDGADCDGKGGCANIPECATLPPGKLACDKAPHYDGAHRTIIVSRTERAAQPSRVILATFPRSDGADCDGKGGCANIPECATLPPGKLACGKAPHYDGAHRTIIVSRTERAAQPSRVIVATFPRSDGADCDGKGGCANIPECATLPPGKLACDKAPHYDGAHRTIIVSRTERAAQPSRVIVATFPRSDGADCDGKGGCANIPECATLPPGKLACDKAPHYDGAHRTIIVSRTERAAQPSRVIVATFPRSDGADCDGKGGCANIPECTTLPPGKLACDKAPHYDGAHRTIIVSRTERAAQPSRVIVATFPRSDGADCDGKGGCANIPECTTLPPGKLACDKAPHYDGAHRTIIVSRTERAAQPSRVILATFPRSDGADCDGKGGCANIPECTTLPPGKLACAKAPHHDGAHRTIIVSRTERAAQPSRVIVATFPRSDGADCDGKGGCANIPECATLPPGKLACGKAPHYDGAHRTIIVSRTERAAQPSRVIVATFPRSDGADCDGKGGCANIPECATLPPGKLACDKAPHYDGAHRTIIVSRTERAAQPSRVIVATFPRSDGADCDGKGGCANIPECATLPPGKLACDKAPHYDGAHRTIIVSRTERAAQPSRVIVATFPRSDGADCDGKGGCANIPECTTLPPGKLACAKAPHHDGAHRTIIVSRTERAAQPSRVIVATFPRSDGADCDGKGGCANIPECATLPPGKLACDKAPHYDGAHRTIIVSRTERAAQPSRVIVATFPRSDGADCDGKGGCANIPECATLPPGKLACDKAPHHDGAHRTIIVSRTERAAQPSRVIVATFPRSDGADCDGKGGCANIPECATLPPGKLACDKAPHYDGAHRTIIVSRTERAAQPSRVIARNISALGRRRLRRERWVREYSRVRHAPPRETRMR
ncbi:hypothetical protein TcYC6_0000390 [Trypanosoma cruzi]|nr:hypothetical protein TcYC6_0000390 [Trypanosoma cruzi]